MDEEDQKAPANRFDPALILVILGIGLVFLAPLSAAFWTGRFAIYFLVGGILVLALGFFLVNRVAR